MKSLGLNLRDAKKVATDGQSSTFQLGSGHQIKIMHGPLSALHRKQIEKMPVHQMADGGDVPASNQGDSPDPSLVDENGNPPVRYSGNGRSDDQIISDQNAAIDEAKAPSQGLDISAIDPNSADAQAVQSQDRAPASASVKKMAATAAAQDGIPNISITDAYRTGQAGNQAQYQAESAAGHASVDAAKKYAAQISDDQANWETERQAKMQEIQEAIKDMKSGAIDPKHYQENMSVGSKIASAIGMILGGASSPVTGHNPAAEFLNNQIDRDINAQKQNQANRATLIGAYQEKYRDAAAAENMARASHYGLYAAKLQQAAGETADLKAKAELLRNSALLQQNIIPLVNNANLIQQGSKFSGVGGQPAGPGGSEAEYVSYLTAAQRLNPELYKDAQSKYVPGMGVSTHPVVKEDQERLENLNSLAPLVDKAIADQKNYGMMGAWSPKNRADAQSDRDALQVSLNKLTGLNRLNDREYQNYGQQIGNVGGMNMGGTLESLKNLKRQLETDRNTATANMGLIPFRGAHAPTGLSPQSENNLKIFMSKNPSYSEQQATTLLRERGLL